MASEASRDPVLSNAEARTRGRQMIQWIENANANDPPCPVTLNTLDYDHMVHLARGDLCRFRDCEIGGREDALKFPEGTQPPADYIQVFFAFGEVARNIMYLAPGVICLYDIEHEQDCGAPHPTDVALTAYKGEYGDINSLRHVFAYGVINEQTVAFLEHDFNARSIAQFGEEGRIDHVSYMRGTPDYEGLLGARIPRTVGYLVLGAFPRGTHRIRSVEVWLHRVDSFNLRFDIEECQ